MTGIKIRIHESIRIFFHTVVLNAKIKGIRKTHIRMLTNTFRWNNEISLFGNYHNNHTRQKNQRILKEEIKV